ncbi:MAG: hypothetical protein MUC62_08315 [Candidatus Thermoplasmatota archaeon]|nr:hypothetical protein [Candidatus Thermoplasmatota archaeon]
MDTSIVDFGQRGDFDVVSNLKIDVPGNYTDEEGYAVFKGETGQDFEHTTITQRTYVNRYFINEQGRTGRWLVIDYELDSSQDLTTPVYVIQMMDVDLGTPGDDSFTWVPERNMTVIHQGTTYIGLALFHFGASSYHGHNAGPISSSIFDGEDKIFNHMYSPNNQTTSAAGQNWYMDIVAKVPGPDVSRGIHVSFAVVVGGSLEELTEAVFDAKAALTGFVQAPNTEGWKPVPALTTLMLRYFGPCFPPWAFELTNRYSTTMTGDFTPWMEDLFLTGGVGVDKTLNFMLDGSPSGRHQYNITPLNQWGFTDSPTVWEWKVDNQGPTTLLVRDDTAPKGTLIVNAAANDGGYSGVSKVFMSLNDGPFEATSSLSTTQQGTDLSVKAYATDMAGNQGPEKVLDHLTNDGVAPTIASMDMFPDDIDEDTEGAVRFEVTASDAVSGLDLTSGRYRYGIDSPSSQWNPMSYQYGTFIGSIGMEWEASQGRDLYLEVEVRDRAGNTGSKLFTEPIEPLNDPPAFSINILSPPWQRETLNIELVGSDPDGNPVSFIFHYSTTRDGQFLMFTPSSIKELDPTRYQLTLPALVFEGEFFLKGEASDGINITPMKKVSTWIDREGPVLELTGPTIKEWYITPRSLRIAALDGGSGVSGTYFIIKKGLEERRVEGSELTISEEGVHTITAYAADGSGNVGKLELGRLGMDLTPPIIRNIAVTPPQPTISEDVFVELTYTDLLSGPKDLAGKDLSKLLEVDILVNGRSVRPQSVLVIPGFNDRVRALFIKPFTTGDGSFAVEAKGLDIAGNSFRAVSEPFEIAPLPADNFLGLIVPKSAEVGGDFVITSNWTGPINLEVSYPNTNRTWIISQKRKEDDIRSFYLPGPYASGKILITAHYGEKGTEGPESIFPEQGYIEVPINGYLDGDGDGLCDPWEVRYGLNHLLPDDTTLDRDKDGLNAIDEMYNLTDPNKEDSDGDGMPDGWEARMGTLPFEKDGDQDPDADGWSNLREYRDGTDPRDLKDHPEDLPNTPWYWFVIIFGILLTVLGYFAFQMVRRKKLRSDLERFDEEVSWEDEDG